MRDKDNIIELKSRHFELRLVEFVTNNGVSFSQQEQETVRQSLLELPFYERALLIYRYYHNDLIEKIAKRLRCTWDEADLEVDRALSELRSIYLNKFKRTLHLIKRQEVINQIKQLNIGI